ncbi:MAG: ribonuclease H-like domain-containing protein [Ignavibacteriaceae bacterium]|nr:ribonuclease H-like domain-containing protein [Ignavibacteriaceae bacterium]
MRRAVIDIETAGYNFEELSESQQEYILRDAMKERDETLREQKADEAKKWLSLYPLSSRCVVIGIRDIDKGTSYIYYESPEHKEFTDEETGYRYKGLPEKEMLESFWKLVTYFNQIITFNGRGFDLPFLMVRSAILRVKPSRNFVGNRYDASSHIDLLEQFSFYGLTKRFNMDFYCHAFGIETPKSKEISGNNVKEFYDRGDVMEIAKYNARDLIATEELYKVWNEYLNLR